MFSLCQDFNWYILYATVKVALGKKLLSLIQTTFKQRLEGVKLYSRYIKIAIPDSKRWNWCVPLKIAGVCRRASCNDVDECTTRQILCAHTSFPDNRIGACPAERKVRINSTYLIQLSYQERVYSQESTVNRFALNSGFICTKYWGLTRHCV